MNKIIVYIFVFTAVLLNVVGDQAQDAKAQSVTGRIVGPSATPQPGVPLGIEGPSGKTHVFTDEKGYWSLYNLPPGGYKLTIPKSLEPKKDQLKFTIQKRSFIDTLTGTKQKPISTPSIELGRGITP